MKTGNIRHYTVTLQDLRFNIKQTNIRKGINIRKEGGGGLKIETSTG